MTRLVIGLQQALEENVPHGITVHIGFQAGAAAREVARRFWGKAPK